MNVVALYARISQDKSGRREGVEAQEGWGREYAASTWPALPVKVYTDNDISAANGDHRPGYEALIAAIGRGEVAQLWAVEQSRLERRDVQWFELAARLVVAGITELHTKREGIIPVGGVVAGIKAVLNKFEVDQLKGRVNDTLDKNAEAGQPAGSMPFGYRHGKAADGTKTYVQVPVEADAIRWAASKVLAGWSLASVAKEWRDGVWTDPAVPLTGPHRVKVRDGAGNVVTDEQGKPVTRDSALSGASVRSVLTSPTVAGKRKHRGEIVGNGNWEPILPEVTWQAVKARLGGPRVVKRAEGNGTYPIGEAHTIGGHSGRKYTLTGGLAVCGRCGTRLGGQVLQAANGKPYLICARPKTAKRKGACVAIMLPETEQYVVDRLFTELDKPEFLDVIAADDHEARRDQIIAGLGAVDKQRGELAAMWGRPGELTSAEWQAARQALTGTERELRAELAGMPPRPARVDIAAAQASWASMNLGEQREFIRLFVEKVTVNKATPGRQGFDSGRVEITWRRV